MLKRIWWKIKVTLFPHMERRKTKRPKGMLVADDMLATAIFDLTQAIEGKGKHDSR